MSGFWYESIRPLLEAQEYVHNVEFNDRRDHGIVNMEKWRIYLTNGRSLLDAHFRHIHITPTDHERRPWIKVTPSERSKGMIVVSRSQRYRPAGFPWKHIITRRNRDRFLFVGLDEEYTMFTKEFGEIDRQKTSNLLEAAELIAGADMSIANQTALFWVAVAMGVPLAQETNVKGLANSVITRPNAVYWNGSNASAILKHIQSAGT